MGNWKAHKVGVECEKDTKEPTELWSLFFYTHNISENSKPNYTKGQGKIKIFVKKRNKKQEYKIKLLSP